MTKRELLKRIKMELWVQKKVGIPAGCNLGSPGVQNIKVPVYFTIGELRTMERALTPKHRQS